MKARNLAILTGLVALSPLAAQSFNIDFGQPGQGPAGTYRAAGLPGVWNSIVGLPPTTYQLVGLDGQLTGVTVRQYGGTELIDTSLGGANDPTGDDAILLKDAVVTHTAHLESCLFFNGLANGTYDVRTYAWMPTAPGTVNVVHIDNNPLITNVSGAWPGVHMQGVTYARHIVQVTNGFMGPHAGFPQGGDPAIGGALNGIQLQRMGPQPILSVTETDLYWSATLQAVTYDVVRGDLGTLHGTGSFTLATQECLADDLQDTSFSYAGQPPAGAGYWFLVRGVNASGNMTYDDGSASQVGLRDRDIDSADSTCL